MAQEIELVEETTKQQVVKKHLPKVLIIVGIAMALVVGYIAGVYHYQIFAAIGPVFGYKSHSGSIDTSSLQQTYNELASNFDGTLDTDLLIQGANRGMVDAAGDDYTMYMSPKEATDFKNGLSGNIGGGIGAEIGIRNNTITIIRILDDNPAKKAGLLANDIILSVNDQPTDGWTVEKTVGLIRGEEGTTVKLSIKRGEVVKEYVITRAIVNNPSVTSSVVDGIGIMTITRFDEETGNLAKTAAQDFIRQKVKSVILDLRENGGGYVDAAKTVAGIWLDDKIVVTEKTGNKVKETVKTSSNSILAGIPTIVLVDEGTASASEIVAGALQDYEVAKLVGEKTFGKGSVQQPIDLDGGALLKVTIARWYTPKGKNITKDKITPDTIVSVTQSDIDNNVDVQLNEAIRLLNL